MALSPRQSLFCLALALFVVASNAFQECELDENGNVICDETQYRGRCGTLYQPRSENWCTRTTGDSSVDLCCGSSIDDCCADSGAASIGAVLVLCLLCLCCCSLVCCKRGPYLFWRLRGMTPPEQRTNPSASVSMDMLRQNQIATQRENAVLDKYLSEVMEQEAVDLDMQKECIVCFENPRDVILPCGHCQMCTKCAEGLPANAKKCPTCRKAFHVYRSVKQGLPSFRELNNPDHVPVYRQQSDLSQEHSPSSASPDLTEDNDDELNTDSADENVPEHQPPQQSEEAEADNAEAQAPPPPFGADDRQNTALEAPLEAPQDDEGASSGTETTTTTSAS